MISWAYNIIANPRGISDDTGKSNNFGNGILDILMNIPTSICFKPSCAHNAQASLAEASLGLCVFYARSVSGNVSKVGLQGWRRCLIAISGVPSRRDEICCLLLVARRRPAGAAPTPLRVRRAAPREAAAFKLEVLGHPQIRRTGTIPGSWQPSCRVSRVEVTVQVG